MKIFKKKQKLQKPKIATAKKLNKEKIGLILSIAFLLLTHIGVFLAIFLSFRYYSIYPALFGSLVAIILCLLAIIDIIFFIGFNHKDFAL